MHQLLIHLRPLTRKLIALLYLIICISNVAPAQDYIAISGRIDSLVKIGLPKSALLQVDTLYAVALKNKNSPQLVKAAMYRMRLQSTGNEKGFITIINTLKNEAEQSYYPVKPVLISFLAGSYRNYLNLYRYQLSQRSRLEKPGTDFTRWDLQTISSEITRLYELSLQDYKVEQLTPIEGFKGDLLGDKNNRYLRPTLYDVLLQEALCFFLNDQSAVNKPKMPFTLNDPRLFSDSRSFANLVISTTDTASSFYHGIKYLQQATLFHSQNSNTEALADIDLQRLQFLYGHAILNNKSELYVTALKQIATSFATKPISADALVLLGKFYQENNGSYIPNSTTGNNIITAVRYFKKAIGNFPESFGAKNAAGYLKMLTMPQLSAVVEGVNIPGKPLLGLINYHNLSTARFTIYKVPDISYNIIAAIREPIRYVNHGQPNRFTELHQFDSVFMYLNKLTPLQNDTLQLPGWQDYQQHSVEFKINSLLVGHYVMVVRDNTSNDSTLTSVNTFTVSHLSYVSRHDDATSIEVRVMDRETGRPLSGVSVTLANYYRGKTNLNGLCIIKNVYSTQQFSVSLTTESDTLYSGGVYSPIRSASSTVNFQTILFTDRQLYRPGQVVYYKGLQLQIQNGKSSIVTGAALKVDITDNNGKKIGTVNMQTNEFGSFSGLFTLPQNMLNGVVTVSTPNGTMRVSVEEYKRPAFKTEFLPVKESYRPGDSVIIGGSATAFAGYGLSKARVIYHVTRNISAKNGRDMLRFGFGAGQQNEEVVTDTVQTDDQGNFKVRFKAAPVLGVSLDAFTYNYNINADITNSSNETHSSSTSIKVVQNNITVVASVAQKPSLNDSIALSMRNLNNVLQSGAIHLTIYSVIKPTGLTKTRLWQKPDQFLLSEADFKKYYPEYVYRNQDDQNTWPLKTKVVDTILITTDVHNTVSFKLSALGKAAAGEYAILINAQNTHGDTITTKRYISLQNGLGNSQQLKDWVTPVITHVGKDSVATFLVGIGRPVNVLLEKYNELGVALAKWFTIKGDAPEIIKVPVGLNEKDVKVSFFMAYQNRKYTNTYPIQNKILDNNLDIKFLTFRDMLQPGQKEQWKVQISGKNKDREAAEMVADMYDASLDELTGATANWDMPFNVRRSRLTPLFNWDNDLVEEADGVAIKNRSFYYFNGIYRNYEMFGTLLPFYDRTLRSVSIDGNTDIRYAMDTVEYRAASYKVNNNTSVDELLKQMPGFEVGADGSVLYQGQAVTKARLNGKDYVGGDMAVAIQNLPADIIQRVQVVDDYGDQAARAGSLNKILNITVKNPVTLRTNFAETAFFYPQLHTDENGQILIDFIVPESLTTWKFRALAHTKDLKTGYVEREIVTQKQLSVTASMPRFLREGDTLTISATLANLTKNALKGKVNLQLFNAVTMQQVSLLEKPDEAQQDFDIAAATNKSVSFKLFIPGGLDALTYRLTAESDDYGDGEENTLPVLANRMLVTETLPMMVRAGQTRNFTFDKLVNQQSKTLVSKSLTLEYTQNPAWYAVQALPYMMEYPYECSEQIFSRYYANSLATGLVKNMPVLKQVFDQWKASNSPKVLSALEKNQELKATLIEETPWLRDAMSETERKNRIALLFDLNKMSYELQTNINKLKDRQLPNGGFPWFGGDKADEYITRYILAGFGQLYHSGMLSLTDKTAKEITDKAMDYLDSEIRSNAENEKQHKTYNGHELSETEVHEWYTESYYTSRKRSGPAKDLLNNYLTLAEKQWNTLSVYEQGLIALTMLRNERKEVADKIIRSLMETAQRSEDLGMYWPKNQLGYFWYQAPIETQSLMIELFTEAGGRDKEVEEMKVWLMRNKQTTNWKTTKATAQACYALLTKGDSLLVGSGTAVIKLDSKLITDLKPGIKTDAGIGYFKTSFVDDQIKPALGNVNIINSSKSLSWGALYWQYTEQLDKISSSNTAIQLERKYFIEKQTASGPLLFAVDKQNTPKTGDLLKVVVHLKADRDFEYMQLKDMRPSGTEPVDVLSAYKYQDGLYYYEVTKDVATNFFISRLNKGSYVFEYKLRVVQPGNYATGISSIQSMYAPEFSAHSEGERMTITK